MLICKWTTGQSKYDDTDLEMIPSPSRGSILKHQKIRKSDSDVLRVQAGGFQTHPFLRCVFPVTLVSILLTQELI
jgi:hypothetical protein